MPARSEIVEARGHLIDSQLLAGIFDKVIALGKGMSAPLCGFELVDRSHTL